MNKLQVFENELFKVSAKKDGDEIMFDAEQVAKSLGFTQIKNQKEYIRWETINRYLTRYVSQHVGKGDLIPEPLVYKLAFKASNDIAEQFQDWLAIEVIPSIRKTGSYSVDTSQLSPELQLMNQMVKTLAKQEMETKEARSIAEEANRKIDNVSKIVSINNIGWREKVTAILRKIAQNFGGIEPYKSVTQLSYDRFEKRAGCKLDIRLNNRKERAISKGMTKTYVSKINKLDVISEEKRLVEIYIQVVKEMAIEFKVDISKFKINEVV